MKNKKVFMIIFILLIFSFIIPVKNEETTIQGLTAPIVYKTYYNIYHIKIWK